MKSSSVFNTRRTMLFYHRFIVCSWRIGSRTPLAPWNYLHWCVNNGRWVLMSTIPSQPRNTNYRRVTIVAVMSIRMVTVLLNTACSGRFNKLHMKVYRFSSMPWQLYLAGEGVSHPTPLVYLLYSCGLLWSWVFDNLLFSISPNVFRTYTGERWY